MMHDKETTCGSYRLSISSFYSFIVGANRPVGHFLSRSLLAQDMMYKGFGLEGREKLNILATGKPFLVLLPSLFHEDDFAHAPFWLGQAQEQDIPVLLLSSLAVLDGTQAFNETSTEFADDDRALMIQQIEELTRRNRRHLILRVGQGFSFMTQDYASHLLTQIREQSHVKLDGQCKFSPTPADDIADVLIAMLKQAACSDELWGTYHFCGVEPVSAYAFAEALLAEAGQYEDLTKVTLSMEDGATLPPIKVPSGDNMLLFHTFGIKAKAWRKGLSRLVRRYYRAE